MIPEIKSYIEQFPKEVQERLIQLHELIIKEDAEIVESFAYKMPSYKLNGKPLIYYAGYKNHIGLYATPTGHKEFEKEMAHYKQGKGSVQFPLNEPLPLDLIKRIVKFRVLEIKTS